MQRTDGFTLVEVMIALVILSFVILGMTTATGALVRNVAMDGRTTTAIQLAEDRVEQLELIPDYAAIDSLNGTVETQLAGPPGFTRETQVVHYGGAGQAYDFVKITVTVSGPGLLAPVHRTVAVGAP